MTNSIAASFLPGVDAIERENAALVEKQTELEASVAQQIADLKARQDQNLEAINTAVCAALNADGMNLLVNPEVAAEVYRLGWESGQGTRPFTDAFHKAIGLPAESPTGWWMFGGADYGVVPILLMFAPFTADTPVEEIKKVAPNMEAVFDAQEDILAEMESDFIPVIVCGWRDGREARIRRDYDTDQWELFFSGLGFVESASDNLADVLVAASRIEGLINSFE